MEEYKSVAVVMAENLKIPQGSLVEILDYEEELEMYQVTDGFHVMLMLKQEIDLLLFPI